MFAMDCSNASYGCLGADCAGLVSARLPVHTGISCSTVLVMTALLAEEAAETTEPDTESPAARVDKKCTPARVRGG
jgi:hypothetical protein